MALVQNPVMGVNLRKNTNTNSAGYGKYYPEVDSLPTLTTRGFAEHMIEHGSKFGLEDITAILRMFAQCLPELVAQGMGVKFDGLGIFHPTIEVKNPVLNIAAMKNLNPRDVVKAVHIRFIPDSSKLDDLSSPKFADQCTLELRNIVESEAIKDGNGKVVKRLRRLTPIETAIHDYENGTANGGGSTTNGTNTGGSTGGNDGGNSGGGGSDEGGGGFESGS